MQPSPLNHQQPGELMHLHHVLMIFWSRPSAWRLLGSGASGNLSHLPWSFTQPLSVEAPATRCSPSDYRDNLVITADYGFPTFLPSVAEHSSLPEIVVATHIDTTTLCWAEVPHVDSCNACKSTRSAATSQQCWLFLKHAYWTPNPPWAPP